MKPLSLSSEQKNYLVHKIKHYFSQEMREEIGQFDAEFLLEFFGKEIGPYFYNQGLSDAQGMIENQIDVIKETIYTMEEPVL